MATPATSPAVGSLAPDLSPAARLAFYRQFIAPGSLVFDIGANLGERSENFLALGAKVVAVEPQPALAARLRERLSDRSGFVVVEAALGQARGQAQLMPASYHTVASMNPQWVERVQSTGRFDGIRWGNPVSVPVITADDLVDRLGVPAFMKIDVEGYEAQVLAGLSRAPQALSFEFVPEYTEGALTCMARLDELATAAGQRYEYNLGLGEHTSLALPDWEPAAALAARLEAYRAGPLSFGDIYARLAVQAN